MSRHSTTLPPPPNGARTEEQTQKPVRTSKTPIVSVPPRLQVGAPTHRHEVFAEALLEASPTRPPHRTFDVVVSLMIHSVLIGILILLPLLFTEAIDLKQFTQTMLVAPPPPPPPPPPAAPAIVKVSSVSRKTFITGGKLMAPVAIPEKIAMIKEEALPPDVGSVGVVGGVPGGVPGGQLGGVIGGILSSAPRTTLPPPPTAAAPKAPVRVGGRIREPRIINRVEPTYPTLARQARMQGDVVIDAVIGVDGRVQEMKVVSGHPLLVPAALEALSKWRYEPTYLNDEPIPVQLLVTLRFRLQ